MKRPTIAEELEPLARRLTEGSLRPEQYSAAKRRVLLRHRRRAGMRWLGLGAAGLAAALVSAVGSACLKSAGPVAAPERAITRWCEGALASASQFAAGAPLHDQTSIDLCRQRYMAHASESAVQRLRCQSDAADADAWRACFDDMPAASGNTVMLDLGQTARSDALLQEDAGVLGGLIGARGTQIGSGGLGSRGSGLGGLGSLSGINGDPIILGALDKSVIDGVIRDNIEPIRACYQAALAETPDLQGKLVIKFVIAKDGSVSKSATKSTTLNSPSAENCINAHFMTMAFPGPQGGGIVIVSYPFLFAPK